MSQQADPQSLLPGNSSVLEKALDIGFGKLLERISPPFPELLDPARTPASFLPYLAADRGVGEWDTYSSESQKRLTVALSWATLRQAGTRKALTYAVEAMEYTPRITAWYEHVPKGSPYSFEVVARVLRDWRAGDHARLIRRLNDAKSESDEMSIAFQLEFASSTAISGALSRPLMTSAAACTGVLPPIPTLRAGTRASGALGKTVTRAWVELAGHLEPSAQLASGCEAGGALHLCAFNQLSLGATA